MADEAVQATQRPTLGHGGAGLADCMHHFVSTATLLNTTTALGFSRETEPTGYG